MCMCVYVYRFHVTYIQKNSSEVHIVDTVTCYLNVFSFAYKRNSNRFENKNEIQTSSFPQFIMDRIVFDMKLSSPTPTTSAFFIAYDPSVL